MSCVQRHIKINHELANPFFIHDINLSVCIKMQSQPV
jgi:hypothetical protein